MAQSNDIDEFLEHYGVMGMKWGIRNDKRGVRKGHSSKESTVRAKRKKISNNRRSLSDGDLRKHISRLSEEKKLKTLINEDLKPGRTIAKKIMSESGQKTARTVISGATLYAVKAVATKKFDIKDAVNYVTPRPKNK
jgi:hypothetical protein